MIGVGQPSRLDGVGQVVVGQAPAGAVQEERRPESVATLFRHDVDAHAAGAGFGRNRAELEVEFLHLSIRVLDAAHARGRVVDVDREAVHLQRLVVVLAAVDRQHHLVFA